MAHWSTLPWRGLATLSLRPCTHASATTGMCLLWGQRTTNPGFWQPAPPVRPSPARGSIVPLGVGFPGCPRPPSTSGTGTAGSWSSTAWRCAWASTALLQTPHGGGPPP
eukprot:11190172-Lingulodinium_polyedra.AAC.1